MRFAALFCLFISGAAAQQVDAIRQLKNAPWVDSRLYQFTRINGSTISSSAVSGNLSVAGAGKVLTFTLCPVGLGASDNVTISGGVGTAETVTVTATTCTIPGGTPGTATVTTANTHTGAWSVTSATGGLNQAGHFALEGVTEPGRVFLRSPKAPMVIWNNPISTAAGEAAGLYINISNNLVATPAANDRIGATIRVTNDSDPNLPLWGMNVMAVQGLAPTGPTAIRTAELEVVNKGTLMTSQLDPWGGAVGAVSVRSNGLEMVGSAGSTYRNAAAVSVWANSTTVDGGWFDKGLALSRVARYGVLARQNPGGASGDPAAFSVCFLCDESDSASVLRVTGSHMNLIDATAFTSITALINLGGAVPTAFVKGVAGGTLLNFDGVKMAIIGPNSDGSGNEAFTVNANGAVLGIRRANGVGTVELGTIASHNLSLIANAIQGFYLDSTARPFIRTPPTAPTDVDIPNNHCSTWNSSGTLTFRCRDNAGTLFTKTL